MAPSDSAVSAVTPPSHQSENGKTSREGLKRRSSDSKKAAQGRIDVENLIQELVCRPEGIDVDSVERFDEAEPRRPGQEKGTNQKRAHNFYEDLESPHRLRDGLLSNDDGKQDNRYNGHVRASIEGPEGVQKALIGPDDGCTSPTMTNKLVGVVVPYHDKGTTRNHISEIKETSTGNSLSLRGLDNSFIATEVSPSTFKLHLSLPWFQGQGCRSRGG